MKLRLTATCPCCAHENHFTKELLGTLAVVMKCENAQCGEEFYIEADVIIQPVVKVSGVPGILRPENAKHLAHFNKKNRRKKNMKRNNT